MSAILEDNLEVVGIDFAFFSNIESCYSLFNPSRLIHMFNTANNDLRIAPQIPPRGILQSADHGLRARLWRMAFFTISRGSLGAEFHSNLHKGGRLTSLFVSVRPCLIFFSS